MLIAFVWAVSCGGSVLDAPVPPRQPEADASIGGSVGVTEAPQAGKSGSTSGAGKGGSAGNAEPSIKSLSGCNSSFIDYDCDGSMEPCPSGQHRDHIGGACSVCVTDRALGGSCEWGRSRYLDFLAELASASCADFCYVDGDCYISELSNACASSCKFALYGPIDEEIVWAAEEFARESCAPFCVSTEPPLCPERSVAACVDHHCVMLP